MRETNNASTDCYRHIQNSSTEQHKNGCPTVHGRLMCSEGCQRHGGHGGSKPDYRTRGERSESIKLKENIKSKLHSLGNPLDYFPIDPRGHPDGWVISLHWNDPYTPNARKSTRDGRSPSPIQVVKENNCPLLVGGMKKWFCFIKMRVKSF